MAQLKSVRVWVVLLWVVSNLDPLADAIRKRLGGTLRGANVLCDKRIDG